MNYSQRIKAARKHAKLTQAELASAVGIAQASISDLERGKSASSTYSASIAKICGVNALWLETGDGYMVSVNEAGGASPSIAADQNESNVEPGPPITTMPRRIEIMGTAQLGNDGYWLGLDNSDGWVETWTRDEDAYALRLKGDSMAPAIRSGWVAVCEPNHRLVPGEYVMVTTVDGQSMVKELLFESEDGVSVMSVNSAYERRTIAWADIDKIHYVGAILGPSKVMCRL